MVGAMITFVTNDALIKYASQTMPAAQLIFVRGVMATLLVLAVAHGMGVAGQWRAVLQPRVAGRAAVDAFASVLYLTSLFHLPLANATAINLAAPLFMIVFAVLFLRERVGVARWLAISVGFGGVLLIIQPRAEGFNIYALVCLAGTLCHATRDLMTRGIATSVPSILVTLSTALAVTLLAGVLSIFQGWRAFTLFEFGLLAAASVFLATGYHLLISSMRSGEMSLIAPFRYSGLLFALVVGYCVWGDIPNLLAWTGIALLIGSGLYVLRSERARQRAALDAAQD
jgi:drug/metabolite transporter (DMT)-like permease